MTPTEPDEEMEAMVGVPPHARPGRGFDLEDDEDDDVPNAMVGVPDHAKVDDGDAPA